jgi:cytochrome c peroxidase
MSRSPHRVAFGVLLVCLGLAIMLVGCDLSTTSRQTPAWAETPVVSGDAITPLPLSVDLDPRRVAIGQKLFADPRLSHDGTIACATCHPLDQGGTDHLQRSIGIRGTPVGRNAPTVFNSGFNFRQFWDGRAATLEDQVGGPLTSPDEMGSNWPEALDRLNASPNYSQAFASIYATHATEDAVKDAIATYERSLVTPNSRFDQYLRGDHAVLTSDELEGYRMFRSYGCISCHQGMNIGGNMYQRIGVMEPYSPFINADAQNDRGRFRLTNDPADDHVFKVPSLRNVAVTGPYFHDGSQVNLESAVTAMGYYQLGRLLTPDEVQHLVAFLGTLTGEYNGQPLG